MIVLCLVSEGVDLRKTNSPRIFAEDLASLCQTMTFLRFKDWKWWVTLNWQFQAKSKAWSVNPGKSAPLFFKDFDLICQTLQGLKRGTEG